MKLTVQQLPEHLKRNLLPIYFISGDEPYQKDVALQQIRGAALNQGYSESQVYHVDRKFDWQLLQQQACSMSLFAEKKIIELRLQSNKPGEGTKQFTQYAQALPEDTILIIVSPKLEPAQQNAKWFKAIANVGAVIAVWPIERKQLPQWVQQQMQQRGLQPDAEALALFCDRIEGNLLAAVQELEKLLLLTGAGTITAADISELVSDSARYDVFHLVDTALAGNIDYAVKIFYGLKAEGMEPVLIAWAFAREIRQLVSMSALIEKGTSVQAVCDQYRVWPKRQAVVKSSLKRGNGAYWAVCLRQCAQLDQIIKGQKMGNRWHELLQLLLRVSGNAYGYGRGDSRRTPVVMGSSLG